MMTFACLIGRAEGRNTDSKRTNSCFFWQLARGICRSLFVEERCVRRPVGWARGRTAGINANNHKLKEQTRVGLKD